MKELADTERAFAAFTVKEGFRDGFIKFFADDGIGFGPHPERTREKLMKTPPTKGPQKVVFNWAPMFGDISTAGDLGYTTGPVIYTDTGDDPRPPRHGMYFSVWQKQADGAWKVAIDIGVSTPEAVAPIETRFTAAAPVKRKTGDSFDRESYRSLDADLSASIAKMGMLKAYVARLDEQFRIHRDDKMPVTDRSELAKINSFAETFEFIDGKLAASGDFAFTYGKYQCAKNGTQAENGYYVHVWRRDAAGKWRLVIDVQNPLPAGNN